MSIRKAINFGRQEDFILIVTFIGHVT